MIVSEEYGYSQDEVVVFNKTKEKWGELSNMVAGFPLVVAGEEWLTTEALYQACRFPTLPEVQRIILKESSPMAAKMKSKPYRKETRTDWDSARVQVMQWVLRVKLAQNYSKFSRVLKETDTHTIVERSHKDRFWGAVLGDDGILRGQNILGKLLMELRDLLNNQNIEILLHVDPPDLANFLILGQVIGSVSSKDRPIFSGRLF